MLAVLGAQETQRGLGIDVGVEKGAEAGVGQLGKAATRGCLGLSPRLHLGSQLSPPARATRGGCICCYFLAAGSKSSGTRTVAAFLTAELHESALQSSMHPVIPSAWPDHQHHQSPQTRLKPQPFPGLTHICVLRPLT